MPHNSTPPLMYTYPDHSHTPVLLTTPIRTRQEFYTALASALRQPKMVKRPAPTNLDGLADLLKEAKVSKVICSDMHVSDKDDKALHLVFDHLGIRLVR